MKPILKIDRATIINHLKLSSQLNRVLEGIATCKIIESKAREIGIDISDEELQQAADDFRITHDLQNIEATWQWLKSNQMSMDEFEVLMRTNIITKKLAHHLFSDRVKAFFFQNHLNYAGAAMYEVILDDEDMAIELFCALQEGEMSFHDIARTYESNPARRRSGGYCGVLQRQNLKPEISAEVFAASPPQLLKPIVTSMGVHLILVEEIIQPQLDEELHNQIMSGLFSEWLQQQLQEFQIVTDLSEVNHQSLAKNL
ncbi:peptidylprolyl isomerase [Waterburya agarophytonicola K14]|uniref:peptidylprolyl isomerase n=1 Tax=Waterburya agarophytonicola KI4 TaxID=2874699 RepID=A0A964BQP8_9CYAN|nr:peptidylprolyl isomerase [Waterburya agarophytonicola]MCC0176783.1 peptidylprolyl isomerase [Waterburya agarophytonicola KI4]